MGRKSLSDVRKKQIVEAFYEVAKREGLENASIAKIADEMGIQPSHVIHYFKNKEELIFSLIEYNLEKYSLMYQPEFDESLPPLEALTQTIDNLFSKQWNALYDDGVFYSCYALTFRNPEIREKYRALHDSLHEMLASAIERCNQSGDTKIDDVKATSQLIFTIIDGAYYYLSMLEDKEEYLSRMKYYKNTSLKLLNLSNKE
ncbi:MAG: TetR family transcriptional regulator [Thalassobius sp.]|nr:TetR family transcriptional regulator [Thalassovita sp.]